MRYKSLFFEVKTIKGKQHVQISYTSERYDQMGKWEGSGQLAELLSVDDHIVLVSPFSQKPFMVVHGLGELEEKILSKYGVKLTGQEVFTAKEKACKL